MCAAGGQSSFKQMWRTMEGKGTNFSGENSAVAVCTPQAGPCPMLISTHNVTSLPQFHLYFFMAWSISKKEKGNPK